MKTREHNQRIGLVGVGPSAVGLLVAADRTGAFEELNGRGLIGFDRGPRDRLGSGAIATFQINSNTEAQRFYQMVGGNGIYRRLPDGDNFRSLAAFDNNRAHLAGDVAPALTDLGLETADVLDSPLSPRSEMRANTEVTHAVLMEDDQGVFYELHQTDGGTKQVRQYVEATGAQEYVNKGIAPYGDVFVSEDIINGTAIDSVKERVLDDGKTLYVVGASHSGLSAAGNLLEAFAGEDFDGLTILTKKPPKLYFPSPTDARIARYEYDSKDLTKKNRVNELGGLRGDAAQLAQQILAKENDRASIEVVSDIESALSDRSGDRVIVQAFGYVPRVIPVYDVYGNHIGPFLDERGRVVTTDTAQLRDLNGEPLPNAYAIGHGHSLTLAANLPAEPSFSGSFENVYYFQGAYGERVVESLIAS